MLWEERNGERKWPKRFNRKFRWDIICCGRSLIWEVLCVAASCLK